MQLVFGGEDGRALFIAAGSALYGVRPWMAWVWAAVSGRLSIKVLSGFACLMLSGLSFQYDWNTET
jgi:hypothetical protein